MPTSINTRQITPRPTLMAKENAMTKELTMELRNYTRELQAKLELLDKAIAEIQTSLNNLETRVEALE